MNNFSILNDRKLFHYLFYFFTSVFSLYIFIYALGISDILRDAPHHTTAILLIDGSALRPYIYRTLIPSLANLINLVTPSFIIDFVSESVLSFLNTKLVYDFTDIAKWKDYSAKLATPGFLYPVTVITFLMYLSILAYGIILQRLSAIMFPKHRITQYCTAIFGLVLLLPCIERNFKVYDPTTLLLSALCLYFMLQQKWTAYLIAFIFASLNKETAILQTVMFAAAFFNRLPKQQFIKLLLLQIGIFAALKLGINLYYSDNPGNIVKYREIWVLARVSRDTSGYHIMVLIMLCWLIFSRWHEIPALLKHSLWIFGGGVLIYYLLGFPYEYRVFFDCFPGMTVIAGYTLFRKLDAKPKLAEN